MKSYIVDIEKSGVTVSQFFVCSTDELAWMEKGYTASLDDDLGGEWVKYSIFEYNEEKP